MRLIAKKTSITATLSITILKHNSTVEFKFNHCQCQQMLMEKNCPRKHDVVAMLAADTTGSDGKTDGSPCQPVVPCRIGSELPHQRVPPKAPPECAGGGGHLWDTSTAWHRPQSLAFFREELVLPQGSGQDRHMRGIWTLSGVLLPLLAER